MRLKIFFASLIIILSIFIFNTQVVKAEGLPLVFSEDFSKNPDGSTDWTVLRLNLNKRLENECVWKKGDKSYTLISFSHKLACFLGLKNYPLNNKKWILEFDYRIDKANDDCADGIWVEFSKYKDNEYLGAFNVEYDVYKNERGVVDPHSGDNGNGHGEKGGIALVGDNIFTNEHFIWADDYIHCNSFKKNENTWASTKIKFDSGEITVSNKAVYNGEDKNGKALPLEDKELWTYNYQNDFDYLTLKFISSSSGDNSVSKIRNVKLYMSNDQCNNGEEKCIGNNYYICESGKLVDKGLVDGKCDVNLCANDDQIILRTEKKSKSKVSLWSFVNYNYRICYDKLFGEVYTPDVNENTHLCKGDSKNPTNFLKIWLNKEDGSLASLNYIGFDGTADLNKDGKVDNEDRLLLVQNGGTDLNKDGVVNKADFDYFVDQHLSSCYNFDENYAEDIIEFLNANGAKSCIEVSPFCQGLDIDKNGKIEALDSLILVNNYNNKCNDVSSSNTVSTEICDNGIDDDGDGFTDGLKNLDPNNGEKKTFGTGKSDVYELTRMVAGNITQKKYTIAPPKEPILAATDGTGGGNRWNDDATPQTETLNKVCEILGYYNYLSYTCHDSERSGNYPKGKCYWHSPEDNKISIFEDATFKTRGPGAGGKYKNRWLMTITCSNRIPQCSDRIDNEGDGKTDFCDGTNSETCDKGCDNKNDDSEIDHDPDCTNPKKEIITYTIPVCYDDLKCRVIDFSKGESCNLPEKVVFRLPSNDPGVLLSNADDADYSIGICCKRETDIIEPEPVFQSFWTNMIDEKITNADLSDLVKLKVSGEDLKGKTVDFVIKKKEGLIGIDWFWPDSTVLSQSSSEGFVTWRTGKKSATEFSAGTFYFEAKVRGKIKWVQSGDLVVSSTEDNSPPFVKITSPRNTGVYFTGSDIDFTAQMYDVDDNFNYVWKIGENNQERAGNSVTRENFQFKYKYTTDKQKYITLTATDDRNAKGFDQISILVIKSCSSGKYAFAFIDKPEFGYSFDQKTVEFDAKRSYGLNVVSNTGETIVSCIGGFCPKQTDNCPPDDCTLTCPIPISGAPNDKSSANYELLLFKWIFKEIKSDKSEVDAGQKIAKGNAGVSFTYDFIKIARYKAILDVGVPKQ